MPATSPVRAAAQHLFQLAMRIDRAEQRDDQDRLNTLNADLAQRLLPVLLSDSARDVSDLMHEFFAVCEQNESLDAPVSIVTEALEDLAAVGASPQGPYALFAVPLLVPHDQVDDVLSADALQALQDGLRRTGMVQPQADVQLLPRLVLVGDLLQFSEWTVSRMANLLAQGRAQDVQELVEETLYRVEQRATLPLEPGVMVFKVLVGVVSAQEQPPFPLSLQVDELLADDDSVHGTRQAMAAARVALDELNALLVKLTGCEAAEVLNEVQGYWEDLSTCEQLMRLVQAQQGLDQLAEAHGLQWEDLMVSSDITASASMPPSVLLAVYAKQGLKFLDTVAFRALPGEDPQDAIESAMQFLQSHSLAVVDSRILPSAREIAGMGSEAEPFDEDDDTLSAADAFVQGQGFGPSRRRLH